MTRTLKIEFSENMNDDGSLTEDGSLQIECVEKHDNVGHHDNETVTTTQRAFFECTKAELDAALQVLGYVPAVRERRLLPRLEDHVPLSQLRAMRLKHARLRKSMKGVDLGRVVSIEWQGSQLDGEKLVHTFQAYSYDETGNFVNFPVTDVDLDIPAALRMDLNKLT